MKKGSIKGMDGSELEAYFPNNLNELDLNELDVNENSAGGGAHGEAMLKAFEELGGSLKKKCCGNPSSCEEKEPHGKPATTHEQIDGGYVKFGTPEDGGYHAGYDSPLDKAFQFGYDVNVDPISKLFKMASKVFGPNKSKVQIDDTIDSDLLETADLRLGRLYRVAGVDLVARFVAQITIVMTKGGKAQQKILLQIKHHGTILYVEEKQLLKASMVDVKIYLNQPF